MIYSREMPDGDESVEFSSLPLRIRELIKHLWETNPEICSPFGSTSDHNDSHDQIGQVSLVDQRVPHDSEDHESLEAERRTGNQAECENENSADNEKQSLLNLSLPEQNVPEDTAAAPETSEEERKCKGKQIAYEDCGNSAAFGVETQPNRMEIVVYENPAEHQLIVSEGNHTPDEIDAARAFDYDSSSTTIRDWLAELRNTRHCRHEENVNKAAKNKNNPKRKRPCRKLSDLSSELKDEFVEIPFPNDFVDDVTQISSRKRKADLKNNKDKKKHKALKTKESPRFDEAEPSNHGVVNHTGCTVPCGSGSVVGRVSMAKPSNLGHRTRSGRPSASWLSMSRVERAKPLKCGPKKLNSDNEINDPRVIEVAGILVSLVEVMTQTCECKGLGECDGCEPSGSLSEVVRASEVNGSRDETETETETETEMVQARESDSENLSR